MKISQEHWIPAGEALSKWFGVQDPRWLPEVWEDPLRLNAIISQLDLWELRSRICGSSAKNLVEKQKERKPIFGFVAESGDQPAEMVLLLPPRKGQKDWLTFSSLGQERKHTSPREIWKTYPNREWINQTIVVQSSTSEDTAGGERAPVSADWFWSAIWKSRGEFFPILPASFLINLFALAMPLFIRNIYDRVVPSGALSTLSVLATGACVVFFFEFLLRIIRARFVEAAGHGADRILSRRVFRHLVQLELSSRPSSAGNLAGKTRGYETVREFLSSATIIGLIDFPFALLMFAIVFVLGGPLGWLPVAGTVLVLAILFLMQPFLAARSLVSLRDSLSRQALLTETANGLESIKAANAGHRIESRMAGLVEDAADNLLSQRRISHLGSSLTALCIHLTTIAVIFFGAIQISIGELSMGGLIACMMIVSRGMAPLGQVSQLLLRLQGVRASLKSLREVMSLEREDDAGKLMPRFECPAIRCVRAGFQYPGQVMAALSEIDLKIEPGEKVGVIGRAGSGKSTLLRLFNRQLRASSGLVLFDGIDANQIAPVAIRRVCGYLPQDGTLFAGSVKENIALGSAFFPDEEIVTAARLAGVLSWANAHPRGLDMEVGERGVLLSGGQRQTVMIARFFLAGARVFLLDEPTNSLDLSAEKRFKSSLVQLLEKDGLPRTLVLATHKLSLLKLVNRVIVIEAGRVLLDGPRDEVLVAMQTGFKQEALGWREET